MVTTHAKINISFELKIIECFTVIYFRFFKVIITTVALLLFFPTLGYGQGVIL